MALKVKAVERLLKFSNNPNDPGVYRYVMKADLYTSLSQAKVIKEAAMRSGVSQGVMKDCWDAAGEVIKAWATKVTVWHCPDLEVCASVCVVSQ